MSYISKLVKKLKVKVGVEITMSKESEMTKWIEKRLMQNYGVKTSFDLRRRLDFEYLQNPYGLVLELNELSSSWWSTNRSGYDTFKKSGASTALRRKKTR